MFCNLCGKNQAVLHINQKVDHSQMELHLCSLCAHQQGLDLSNQFSLSDIVAGISMESLSAELSGSDSCDFCQLSYENFAMAGRFGCSYCYSTFEKYLDNIFKNIQGSVIHKGKVPLTLKKERHTKEKLQKELAASIDNENYERAAQIRDQLKELENEF